MAGPTNAFAAEKPSAVQPTAQPPAALIFVGPKRAPVRNHATLKTMLLAAAGLGFAGVLSMMFPPVRARVSLVRTSLAIALFRGGFLKKFKAGAGGFMDALRDKVIQWRNRKSAEDPEVEVHRPTPVELLLKKIGAPNAKGNGTASGLHAEKAQPTAKAENPPALQSSGPGPVANGPVANGSTAGSAGGAPIPEQKPAVTEPSRVAIEPMRVVTGPVAPAVPAEKAAEPVNA